MTDEAAARDAALDRLETTRRNLIQIARNVADELCARHVQVTAPDVKRAMLDRGLIDDDERQLDPRWMGAVFRAGQGWERVGWTPEGSHCRPVAIWRTKETP